LNNINIENASIAVCTRFWGKNPEEIKILKDFILQAKQIGPVFVAINVDKNKTNAVQFQTEGVNIFPVTPWGKFVPALNALVYKASCAGCTHILFASATVDIVPDQVQILLSHMDNNTLAVGAALEGHNFQPGRTFLNADGRQVPWNTLCLWKANYLGSLGFPLIGDAYFDEKSAGVEEVATFGVLQSIYKTLNVKLIEIPGITWNTNFTGDRLEKHLKKMASKITRPEKQLECAYFQAPTVMHIG